MKTPYTLIPLFLLIFAASCKDINSSSKTESQLYSENKIKTRTEYIAHNNLGLMEPAHIYQVKEFNTNGLAIKETAYKNDGKLHTITTFEYDKNNNLIKTRKVAGDSSFLAKYINTFNDKNLIAEQYCYESSEDGPFLYHKDFTYDADKKLQTINWSWPTGKRAIDKYIYDGKNVKEFSESNAYGDFLFKWEYKYDIRNNCTEAIQYYDSSAVNAKTVSEYNVKKELVKQTKYNKEAVETITTYEYDDRGLLIKRTDKQPSGKVFAIYTYKYESY